MNVNLRIYNIRGQLVDVLQDQVMSAGRHSLVWNAENMSAGMFFVRMTDGGGNISGMQKVILMK